MEQSKTRTYTLYAIGEILLVMIGILLALQVNNWNEQKKRDSERVTYHERLLQDIERMIEDMEGSKQFSKDNFQSINRSLNILMRGTIAEEEDSVFTHFLDTYFKFSLNIERLNTYYEMQSAGKLELIENAELLNQLAKVLDRQDFITEVHQTFHRNSHLTSDYLDPYLLYSFKPDSSGSTVRHIEYNFSGMAKDELLIRKISRQAMLWEASMSFMNSFLEMIERLHVLMQQEYKRIS